MNFSFKLLDNDKTIKNKILSALADQLNPVFSKAGKDAAVEIQAIVKQSIESEGEYLSLISGQLKYELGIANPSIVDQIVDIWVKNISVSTKRVSVKSSSLTGGLSISMIKSDYSDVLGAAGATIKDSETGSIVPWLEWLLLRGGDILVKDYEVLLGPNPRSRTGMAVMVSSKKDYRMPAKFAGTESNNWVYRAISRLDDSKMQNIIQKALEKNI